MKLCDVHAHIGHWPFRRLPYVDAASLLREMDRLEIERAAVCSNHGVFYKNTQAANEELAAEVAKLRDRLTPIATVNPAYVAAEADFRICLRELGMAGLRLVPQYHGYSLDDPRAISLAVAAGEAGIPVIVPRYMVDTRQRHRLDVEETVELATLAAFARKAPGATIVGVEYGVGADPATVELLTGAPNLLLEISRIPYLNAHALPDLITRVGAGRFLFGTGMPFKTPEVSILKLELLEDDVARGRIAAGGFLGLFKR